MDRAEIEALLERYYKAFNSLDPDAVAAVFSPDCQFVDLTLGREMNGLDELRGFVRYTAQASPTFRVEPNKVLIDGNDVAVSLTMSGIDAETRAPWSVPSSSTFKVRDGLIVYKADLWNLADALQQVGRSLGDMPEDRE